MTDVEYAWMMHRLTGMQLQVMGSAERERADAGGPEGVPSSE